VRRRRLAQARWRRLAVDCGVAAVALGGASGGGVGGGRVRWVEDEGGRSGGVVSFYWALPRHQRWRVTAAPRWVARQTLPRRRHVILPQRRHFAAPWQ